MESLNAQGELFAIWRRWSAATRGAGSETRWGDDANESNSIIDAETLTCLLLPSAQLSRFNLSSWETATADAVASLSDSFEEVLPSERLLNDPVTKHILTMLEQFFDKNMKDGVPSFRVGSYAGTPEESPSAELLERASNLEVTDSYAFSISVCLYTLMLIQGWENQAETTGEDEIVEQWSRIKDKTNTRLTYALSGLLSSFCVNVMSVDSWKRNTRYKWPKENEDMERIRDGLNALGATIGLNNAFNVGWSWAPVPEKKRLMTGLELQNNDLPSPIGQSQIPPAQAAPYFYFTVSALDSIAGLNERKVQAANVLNPTQLVLSSRLIQYWHITIDYWTNLAFTEDEKNERWAIEDIPWTAADHETTEYWSLYMLGIITRGDAQAGHKLGGRGVERLIPLVEDLASRARITRRPEPPTSDEALRRLHSPGHVVEMFDADNKKVLTRPVYDFAPRLLKLCGRLLALTTEEDSRERILKLANQIWLHLSKRRIEPTIVEERNSSSWDTLARVYEGFDDTRDLSHAPAPSADTQVRVASWYITERVTEALVAVAESNLTASPPTANADQLVQELASELEYLAASDRTAEMPVESRDYNKLLANIQEARLDESSAMALLKLIDAARTLASWKKSGQAD